MRPLTAPRQNTRQTAQRPKTEQTVNVPSPTRGLVLSENLSAMQPGSALIMDNWFPLTNGIRVRGGKSKYATLGTQPVESIWSYVGTAGEKMFAAADGKIFDISAIVDHVTVPTPVVTGRTSNYYCTAQIGSAGGNYQYVVNGDDKALLYDGTSFTPIDAASTPAITGVSTSLFSHVWLYANRLFFVQRDSRVAWFLPVDQIGGAAQSFSLDGVFQKGGSLLFGAVWSLDAGDGLDDKCVFVSTEGEIAVYQGSDPASAANWQKVGVYPISKPLGPKAVMPAGGDLLIATEDGLVPISEAVKKDRNALSMAAVSQGIKPLWVTDARDRRSYYWEIIRIPMLSMMMVALPSSSGDAVGRCYVANIQTGAFATYSGWDVRCATLFDNVGYFGSNNGKVYIVEKGGSDDGLPYVCDLHLYFDHLNAPGVTKTVLSMRTVFRSAHNFTHTANCSVDYRQGSLAAPPSVNDFTLDEWDSGLWDTAFWDVKLESNVTTRWRAVDRTGFAFAPHIKVTFGITPTPRVELVAIDLTIEPAGPVG